MYCLPNIEDLVGKENSQLVSSYIITGNYSKPKHRVTSRFPQSVILNGGSGDSPPSSEGTLSSFLRPFKRQFQSSRSEVMVVWTSTESAALVGNDQL